MDAPTKPKRIPNAFGVYLGDKPLAVRRMERLDTIARNLGMSRNKLIAAIADGRLLVIANPNPSIQE